MSPTRRTFLRSLAATGAVGLAGCSTLDRFRGPNENSPESLGSTWSPPADEWRFPAADVHNTARSSLSVDRPTTAWTADPPPGDDGCQLLAATADRVVVAAGGADETVVRVHAAGDGAVQWRRRFESSRLAPGGLVADRLFVATETDVLALDPADGTTRWRTPLYDRVANAVPAQYLPSSPSNFDPWPLATLGTVYVQSRYGLHGLAPGDGTERWRLSPSTDDEPRLGRPTGFTVTSRSVWASYGFPSSRLFELSDISDQILTSSTPLRTEHALRPVVTEPGVSPELAVGQGIASTAFVSPLVAGYGSARDWTFAGLAGTDGPSAVEPPATDGERVFVPQARSVADGYAAAVVALDAHSGTLAWSHDEPMPAPATGTDFFDAVALAPPVVAADAVLLGYGVETSDGTEGVLAAFDAADGTVRWRLDLDVAPAGPVVAGDRVYVGDLDGGVTALTRG